jgi:hypothetical protein
MKTFKEYLKEKKDFKLDVNTIIKTGKILKRF